MFNQNKIPIQHRATAAHVPNANSVYIGLVRENQDPQRMGRLLVWISDFGPDLEENWVTVSYASPFAGVTPMEDVNGEKDTMDASQKSYGWWATPPDKDNQVLCCFINGDTTNGFYFACLYPQNMNHMVPGIGFGVSTDSSLNDQFKTYDPPVVEYNKKRAEENTVTSTSPNGAEGTSAQRPVFTPLAEGLLAQGLQEDAERGISNTSARRESPSHVFGLLSPRGNTIHIDDGFAESGEPQNEFIRFRTRSGAQILIHETSGYIYMITKGGNSWIEISDAGIDMYSSGPISMRSGGDVNIHADGAINMHGTTGINMKAAQFTSFTSGNTNFTTESDFLVESAKDSFFIAGNNFGIEATRDIGLMADHDILMAACGVISRNAEGILDNSSGGMPEPAKHAEFIEGSVTSRVPDHEPYADHFSGTATITGIDANGNPTIDVVDSEGNLTTKPAPIPKAMLDRARAIYRELKRRGFTDIQCAAILGCWQQESSLNPNAQEPRTASTGWGIGLGQWSRTRLRGGGWGPGRRAELLAFAKARGKPWNDQNTQIDFFVHELDTTEARAGRTLRSATTLSQALKGMQQFERFGVLGNRDNYSVAYVKSIKDGKFA